MRGNTSKLIFEVRITVIAKEKDTTQKKLQDNIPDEYRCKYPQGNITKQNL